MNYYSEFLNRVGKLTGGILLYRLEYPQIVLKDLNPKTAQEPKGDLDALGQN